MSDDATPAKVRLTDGLGPLPEPLNATDWQHSMYTADQMRAYAAAAVAAERERLAGSNDLEAMCEAFHRLIEAHANLRSPFHQPVCADAQMALRVLRGVVAGLRA